MFYVAIYCLEMLLHEFESPRGLLEVLKTSLTRDSSLESLYLCGCADDRSRHSPRLQDEVGEEPGSPAFSFILYFCVDTC